MPVTVNRLLDRADLGLRLLSGTTPPDDAITWVAATDLENPTPFLADGNVVLTTGRQFQGARAIDRQDAAISAYVERLRRFGIRAIGFGSNVFTEVPPALISACEQQQMPLFDVPYRTPFLAIIRYVADLVAAEAHERAVWAADAQRAISIAALRDDGLAASITELARRLRRGVSLFDARGDVLHARPEQGHPSAVADDAERMLTRGVRAASTSDTGVLLQTIGRGGDLRGVLAVDGPLDHAAQSVVAAVVALAGMALERQRSLVDTALRLRTGAWRSLCAGDHRLAADLAGDEVLAATFTVGMLRDDALSRAELTARSDLFVALDAGHLVVINPATTWAETLYAEHGIPSGLSRPATAAQAPRAAQEAAAALRRATRVGRVVAFDSLTDGGFRTALDTTDAHAIAAALIAPLATYDTAHATELAPSLEQWLRHNGQWDPAARALGIHRHTLKSRVTAAERILEHDLSNAEHRAELLLAFTLSAEF